jgi:antitoxin ChpS
MKKGRFVVEPKKRRHYSVGKLLAQCGQRARRSREERNWVASPPVGRELV